MRAEACCRAVAASKGTTPCSSHRIRKPHFFPSTSRPAMDGAGHGQRVIATEEGRAWALHEATTAAHRRRGRAACAVVYPSASIASATSPAAAPGIAVAAPSSTSSRGPGIRARSPRHCRRGRTGRGGRGRRAWGPRSRAGARASGVCSRAGRTPCPAGWPSGPGVRYRACGPRCAPPSSAQRRGRRRGSRRRRQRTPPPPRGRPSRASDARTAGSSSPRHGRGGHHRAGRARSSRVPTRVSAENTPGWSSAATWATIPPTPIPARCAGLRPSASARNAASAARSRRV